MTDQTKVAQHPATTDQEKRRQLREKIEAGEKRNAERSLANYAKDAADTATGFVKRHPLATIAGGITLGLVIGALTRPGRRLTSRVGRRSGALAALAADAALAYGLRALEGAGDLARSTGDRIEDMGDTLGTKARGVRRDAAYRTEIAGDALRSVKRSAGRKSGRALRDLRNRFAH